MPQYTNKYKLPKMYVDAAIKLSEAYDPDPDAFRSNTGLIKPAQIATLERRHSNEIVVDVADLVYIVIGKAVHYVFENVHGEQYLREQRFRIKHGGDIISTTIDLYDTHVDRLTDWKITSLWSVIGSMKDEWEAQLNIQAHALRIYGYNPEVLEICAILRDWSKSKAFFEMKKSWTNYPPVGVQVVTAPMWDTIRIEQYLQDRIEVHKKAEATTSDAQLAELYPCTSEERWEKKPTYAVMKQGRKSAVRVLDSMPEAVAYLNNVKKERDKHYIDVRKGESPRCQMYCDVQPFCQQWKEIGGLYE